MLNCLGPEWDNVKWALKVRSGRLTVELVTQHLLAAEGERKKAEKDSRKWREKLILLL